MQQAMYGLGKLILLAIYLLTVASYFMPELAQQRNFLTFATVVLLAVHIGEYLLVGKRLRAASPGGSHFVQTLLFGFLHFLPRLRNP